MKIADDQIYKDAPNKGTKEGTKQDVKIVKQDMDQQALYSNV